ncbi:hypothetical protein [Clostridium beijerinckii]|uniref:Flagellar protein FliT n=1 Tax=Clostridium beijerinckii TaxID=1520 RepID=A0A1S9NCG2_CLOBE|nr:hypothetical protein [Clostridium beijerinckii]OOP75162.1 hypothetical protein CBEIBR21_03055 [Clostridium beijerinckii]
MNIEEKIIKYRDITMAIIEIIRADEEEELDDLFVQRQLILDYINKIDYSKDELKKLYLKHEIGSLDKILEVGIKSKKEEVLKKIKANQKRKTAMNGYNNLQTKAVFLSKEF